MKGKWHLNGRSQKEKKTYTGFTAWKEGFREDQILVVTVQKRGPKTFDEQDGTSSLWAGWSGFPQKSQDPGNSWEYHLKAMNGLGVYRGLYLLKIVWERFKIFVLDRQKTKLTWKLFHHKYLEMVDYIGKINPLYGSCACKNKDSWY